MCTQSAYGWWSSFLTALDLEENSPSHIQRTATEDAEMSLLKLCTEEKQGPTTEILTAKEEVLYNRGPKIPQEEVEPTVCKCGLCDIGQGSITSRKVPTFDKKKFPNRRSDSASCVPENRDLDGGADEVLVKKNKLQETAETTNEGSSRDHSSKLLTFFDGFIGSKQQKSTESLTDQIKEELNTKAENIEAKRRYSLGHFTERLSNAYKDANTSYSLGYFTERLSEACKDAGRRIQGTRELMQHMGVGGFRVVLFQYAAKMSKELPLLYRIQPNPEPEPSILPEDKVSLTDLSKDHSLSLPRNSGITQIPGVSGWPKGSVSCLRDTCPEVFYQKLVQVPPALSQLQSLSSQEILQKLEFLAPQVKVNKLLGIFWLKTASRKRPIPKPGCLLLSDKDIMVLSSATGSNDTVVVFHHFKLMAIKEVQIGLAGQHIRLIGCTEDIVLALFTYSQELTQEFCMALLKALSVENLPEGIQDHPLLSGDLMTLSLDWMSNAPDIVLDNGLRLTSRFKRVLADLLYIVHGNMDGLGKPPLANICPLLYTSVKVMTSNHLHLNDMFQFLLTDTHLVLLHEDGVFHPAPRGSSLVPAQPQFRGLELRKRSNVGCVIVNQNDSWLTVDIMFTNRQPQTWEKEDQCRRNSIDVPSVSRHSGQRNSWKLSFGCTSEAAMLMNHLCSSV